MRFVLILVTAVFMFDIAHSNEEIFVPEASCAGAASDLMKRGTQARVNVLVERAFSSNQHKLSVVIDGKQLLLRADAVVTNNTTRDESRDRAIPTTSYSAKGFTFFVKTPYRESLEREFDMSTPKTQYYFEEPFATCKVFGN